MTSSKPLVSVIVPTFNRLSYLKKAVASALGQSYKNIELIIMDNASHNDTEKWCLELEKNETRVRYVRNSKNLGMIGNWNEGLGEADGKYVSILMDDDLWEKRFLSKTVKVLEKNNDVGLVCVFIDPHYDETYTGIKKYPRDLYRLYKKDMKVKGISCIEQFLKDKWLVGLPSGILVRKKSFNELGKFNQYGLDPEMWLRICSEYNFYYLDENLCHWGIHGGDSFTSKNTKRNLERIFGKFRILDKIFSYNYTPEDYHKLMRLKKDVYRENGRKLVSYVFDNLKDMNKKQLKKTVEIYNLYFPKYLLPFDLISMALTGWLK